MIYRVAQKTLDNGGIMYIYYLLKTNKRYCYCEFNCLQGKMILPLDISSNKFFIQ
jgi:hypothetical protein